MSGPYNTGGNPSHPGVEGQSFVKGVLPEQGPRKVDSPGTGTFAPNEQGTVGKASPQGLSATNQYGEASPGVIPGESPLASPMVHPLPTETEGDGAFAGRAPQMPTQEEIRAAQRPASSEASKKEEATDAEDSDEDEDD